MINRNTGCIQDDLAKQFLTREILKRNISQSSVGYGSLKLATPRPMLPQRVRPPSGFMVRCSQSGRANQILVGLFRKKDHDALTKELFGVALLQCLLLLVQRLKIQNYHNFILKVHYEKQRVQTLKFIRKCLYTITQDKMEFVTLLCTHCCQLSHKSKIHINLLNLQSIYEALNHEVDRRIILIEYI